MGRSKIIIFFKFFTHMCRSKEAIDAIEPKRYPSSQASSTTEHTEPPPRSSTTSSDGAPPRTDLLPSSSADRSTTNAPRADIVSSISDPSTTTTNVSIPIYSSTSYYDSSTTSISIMSPKPLSTMSPRSLSMMSPRSPRAGIVSSISDPSTTTTNVSIPIYSSTSYYASSTTSISIMSPRSLSMMSPRSLSMLRDSLSNNPYFYDLHEISVATINFLANKYTSSSTASWQCSLRGKEALVFQRKLQRSMENSQLGDMLSLICRSNHKRVIKLLGASISNEHIYLVYEFINGLNLADCLRNPTNSSSKTLLSTWISRMEVALDIARGLDYIHNNMGQDLSLVHKHIKSSSIVITEPLFSAKLCHLGRAQLCAETDENMPFKPSPIGEDNGQIAEMPVESMYMAPEFQSTGIATQKTDVYAFGVLVLELLSGEDPLECEFNEDSGDFRRTLMIETARKVMDGGGGGGEEREREGRLRMWIDKKLNDSFPVSVAERLTHVAMECVHEEPDKRPDMRRVAWMISQLYLDSSEWWDGVRRVREPLGISDSLFSRSDEARHLGSFG